MLDFLLQQLFVGVKLGGLLPVLQSRVRVSIHEIDISGMLIQLGRRRLGTLERFVYK